MPPSLFKGPDLFGALILLLGVVYRFLYRTFDGMPPQRVVFFMVIRLLCFAAKSKVFVNQRFAEESLRVMLFLLLWARCIRIVLQTISVKKKGDYGLEYKGFAFV